MHLGRLKPNTRAEKDQLSCALFFQRRKQAIKIRGG